MQLRFMYRASIRKHWHEFCTMHRGAQESLELESQEATLLGWFLSCVWIWVGFNFPLSSISVCLLQMESFSVFHQDRCRCIKKWNQMLNSEGTTIILACYQVCKQEVGLAAKLNIATFVAFIDIILWELASTKLQMMAFCFSSLDADFSCIKTSTTTCCWRLQFWAMKWFPVQVLWAYQDSKISYRIDSYQALN